MLNVLVLQDYITDLHFDAKTDSGATENWWKYQHHRWLEIKQTVIVVVIIIIMQMW